MEHKPIAIMILSLFIIWILILGTMAATGNAQEGTIQPESNFTGNIKETQSGNEHECFDEFAQLETCIANPENGATTQESSNTGNATEVANPQNGAATQESSNTGNATEVANNPAPLQEMVPAFQITTKQLANGLTEEKPAASTNPDCNRTVCVGNAPHTGFHPGESPPLPTYEDLRPQLEARCSVVHGVKVPCDFLIIKVKGKETGLVCPERGSDFHTVFHGVEYTICAFDKTSEATKPQQLPSTPFHQPCTAIETCGQR
jgi:hypothetical protein